MTLLSQISFKNPLFLFLILLIPLVYWIRPKKPTVIISDLNLTKEIPIGFWAKARPLLSLLRGIIVLLLIIALARPQLIDSQSKTSKEGIDVFIILDISGSMMAEDFKPKNRLTVAKSVINDFLKNRKEDRIGLIVFAGQALTICPLTFDYHAVGEILKTIKVGMIEDGTAIGSAIAITVNRLRDSTTSSKIAILLTDGENNAGEISPQMAAEMAKLFGIRIYTIGMGKEGGAKIPYNDPIFGKQYREIRVHVDEETLEEIAQTTSGTYFRATDTAKLESIYEEINRMETTQIATTHFQNYREISIDFLLPIAIVLLLLEILLSQTKLRTLP